MKEEFYPEKYFQDERLIKLTLQQLKKDFAEFGVEFDEPLRHFTFDHLVGFLREKLISIDKSQPGILTQLYYRIDLPEEKLRHMMENKNNFFDNAAILILKRELQKVVIKEFYKNKLQHETEHKKRD